MKSYLLLLYCLWIPCLNALAADSTLLKGIPYACYWINTPHQFNTSPDGNFRITAAKGTDFYNYAGGGYDIATAPLLLFQPDSNFVLTAKVQIQPDHTFDGGALYLYRDSLHWSKFLFEKAHGGKPTVCSGVTNTYTDDNNHAEITGNTVYLRMGKSGNLIGLYYSINGRNWKMVRLFYCPPGGPLRIGFSSQSPEGTVCTTSFSNVVYSPKGFKDFWTGE